ncbi:MAG: hypothetical protein ACAI34_13735, partial [Verrucomicrobium sp.]
MPAALGVLIAGAVSGMRPVATLVYASGGKGALVRWTSMVMLTGMLVWLTWPSLLVALTGWSVVFAIHLHQMVFSGSLTLLGMLVLMRLPRRSLLRWVEGLGLMFLLISVLGSHR